MRTSSHDTDSARSYHQYCAVARALDLIGERWTLLIVRELLTGPKRYKDLLDGLPGIGTNLLAARLRHLESADVIRREVLPPPAGSTVYELTDIGQQLESVVMAIGLWGARLMRMPLLETDVVLPNAYFVAMRARFKREAALGVNETYVLRVDRQVFEVRVQDGRCFTRQGASSSPRSATATFTLGVGTLNALLLEGLAAEDALRTGQVKVDGDPRALERFLSMFRLLQAMPPADDDAAATAKMPPARDRSTP